MIQMSVDDEMTVGKSQTRPRVCVIGAGNVASHLAPALSAVADVVQICARSVESASRIASEIPGCQPIDSPMSLVPDADFYIIMANDDAIEKIAAESPDFPGIWAHTSGSVPMEVFKGRKSRFGVFYPLQTFSKGVDVEVSKVPMFVEGSSADVAGSLKNLAEMVSARVELADSNRRKALHVAAVFACNFVNFMWEQADDLLREENLDISFLMPLLEVTLGKIGMIPPREGMTGPARRGDLEVIAKHLRSLSGGKRRIYASLTEEILREFHPSEAEALKEIVKDLPASSR